MYRTFTHKGELVIDPFVGIGTTLVAARDLERNAAGFDLSKKYIDFTSIRKKRCRDEEKEICNECGRDVSWNSGSFVNRVLDLDDYKIRKEMNKPFPEGDYICRECEAKLNSLRRQK